MRDRTDRTRRLPNLIVSAIGFGGTGKTRLALSGRRPVRIVTLDPNTQYVVDQAIDDGMIDQRDVHVYEFKPPPLAWLNETKAADEAYDTWGKILDTLEPLVDDPADKDIGLVAFDTANALYDVGILAEIGKLDQIHPETRKNKMGLVNRRYKNLMIGLHQAGHDVLLLHLAKEKWETKEVRTGRGMTEERRSMNGPFDMERSGFKDTSALVSIEVGLSFDTERTDLDLDDRFGLKWFKNTHRPGLTGHARWGMKALDKSNGGGDVHCCTWAYVLAQSFPKADVQELV